jgi:hypothetical protein
MKKILSLVSLSFMCTNSFAQDCNRSLSTIDFFPNDIKTELRGGGAIWNGFYAIPANEPPLDEQPGLLYTGQVWIGGLDNQDNLHVAAGTYGFVGSRADFFPGPINENGTTNAATCSNFDRHFSITKNQIDQFKADFSADGFVDGSHIFVYRWPGRGNPHFASYFGFELPDQDMAPFIDHNQDGLYNPDHGDHPDIKGDQAVWWIYNDIGGVHSESNGEPVGVEIQIMAYAFNSEQENISNASFYDISIKGKGFFDLHDLYVSMFVDGTIGCYTDDFAGCIPEENLAFTYNSDAVDGTAGCQCAAGYPTYCEEVPVMGVKLLSGTLNGQSFNLSGFSYYNNGGVQPEQPIATTDPGLDQFQYYNYMQGLWRDGTPITEGGSGYDPDGGTPTDYAFPGNPADETAWTMCSANLDLSADRRMILRTGPFDFVPGDEFKLSYALLYVADVPHPCPDITPLIEAGQEAQALFDELSTSTDHVQNNLNLEVFPNPFSASCTFKLNGEGNIQYLNITDTMGKTVQTFSKLNSNEIIVNRQELPPGVYFYQLQNKAGKTASGKIIIQ